MDANAVPFWLQLVIVPLIVVAAFFLLVGAIGLARFGDVFQRLHAPTKASTLGLGGLLLASMLLSWSRGEPAIHEILITLFVFITAPVAASLLAQAALHRREPADPPPPADQPEP